VCSLAICSCTFSSVPEIAGRTTGGTEIGRNRGPQGRERIRGAQTAKAVYKVGPGLTGIGVVVQMGMVGLSLALTPIILALPPASVWSDLFLALAGSLFIWSMLGLWVEFDEIKKYRSGIEQEGWDDLIIAAVLLAPAGAFFAGVQLLEAPAWIEIPLRVLAVPLFILGLMFVASALDALFIKPRLKRLGKKPTGQSKTERNSLLGGIAAATTWALTNAASLLAIIERLSSSAN
jgi:hypothetical protein